VLRLARVVLPAIRKRTVLRSNVCFKSVLRPGRYLSAGLFICNGMNQTMFLIQQCYSHTKGDIYE